MNKSPTVPTIQASGLEKQYWQAGNPLRVLRGVDLQLFPGEIVALVGESGSGKSTLLQLLGLLDTPTGGRLKIEGQDVSGLADDQRSELRRLHIGFVYQFHHLLPQFTACENIMLAHQIMGHSKEKAHKKALELLNKLNLKDRADHRPSQLSGGEQQRVAILRALAGNPLLLLADEPTGNLDEKTADLVFNELMALARENQTACLIATHSPILARRMDRLFYLKSGVLTEGANLNQDSKDNSVDR